MPDGENLKYIVVNLLGWRLNITASEGKAVSGLFPVGVFGELFLMEYPYSKMELRETVRFTQDNRMTFKVKFLLFMTNM